LSYRANSQTDKGKNITSPAEVSIHCICSLTTSMAINVAVGF